MLMLMLWPQAVTPGYFGVYHRPPYGFSYSWMKNSLKVMISISKSTIKTNKLAKLRRCVSRVHFAKIHFGKIHFSSASASCIGINAQYISQSRGNNIYWHKSSKLLKCDEDVIVRYWSAWWGGYVKSHNGMSLGWLQQLLRSSKKLWARKMSNTSQF